MTVAKMRVLFKEREWRGIVIKDIRRCVANVNSRTALRKFAQNSSQAVNFWRIVAPDECLGLRLGG